MKLTDIKGFKAKRIALLNKAGIFQPEDLILRFPRLYAVPASPPDFSLCTDGESVAFVASIASKPSRTFIRKGLSLVKVKLQTLNSQTINCTWFNQPYVYNQLVNGGIFLASGKIKKGANSYELVSPSISIYKDDSPKVIPIYKPIRGVPSTLFGEAVKEILANIKIDGYFDDEIINKYSLMPLDEAVRTIHMPIDLAFVPKALTSVMLEKLSYMLSIYNMLKSSGENSRVFNYSGDKAKLNNLINSLPYKLTDGQRIALDDIFSSLNSPRRMNRLIQGDVGCGKTVVALITMYYAALSGYQSVLMAPTEILARQHYINALKLFEGTGINIELLTGSTDKSTRDNKKFNIKNGVCQLIVGTHSLISEDIEYCKLSLVITDEQHRFGVSQRAELENKSCGADILVMSATPIPRTLALTVYGDLEQTQILTMPLTKAKILTRIVPESKTRDMYNYLKQNAAEGLQTYIVCPRVEDEDDTLTSAQKLYNEVKDYFNDGDCELLHGQMRERDKNAVMQRFASGKTKVLVTTTLIEVGVDVKNAVNIVIYNPERYGLSQLHQLRGRVGRGEKISYCFIVGSQLELEAKERIEYFSKCNNGFELAEYDFNLRGAGDFLGTRQHGGSDEAFNISPSILKTAKEISDYLICIPKIREEIAKKTNSDENDYIKSLTLN